MNTTSAITSAIMATSPTTSTPTAEAIQAATQYFQANTDGNNHFILLSTDGLPSCSGANDVQNAENAVTAAAMAGIKTIVVGIGNDPMGDTALTTMANNGGMPDTTPGNKPYYQVNTTTDLVNALNKITGQIVSCSYALQMAPANPELRRNRRQQRHADPARHDPHERLGLRPGRPVDQLLRRRLRQPAKGRHHRHQRRLRLPARSPL